MQPGQDDDDLVSGVDGLGDQGGEIRRLAALNVTDDESADIEPVWAVRVLKVGEHPVTRQVEVVDFVVRPMELVAEEGLLPLPVVAVGRVPVPEPWPRPSGRSARQVRES